MFGARFFKLVTVTLSSFPSGQSQVNLRVLELGEIIELALGLHFQLYLMGGGTAQITKEVSDGTTVIIQALLLLV